jgi:hypothetical protein
MEGENTAEWLILPNDIVRMLGECGSNRTQLISVILRFSSVPVEGQLFGRSRGRLFRPLWGGVCSYPPFKAVVVLAGDSVSSLVNLNIISLLLFFSVQIT